MLRKLPLTFLSQLLLAVMLIIAVNGMHERAHAMACCNLTAASSHSSAELSAKHDSPATPLDQHHENDGCDSCVDCACHAPLPVQRFNLCYTPIVLHLTTFEPFRELPEVYLSKFIPPQIHA